MAAVTLAVVYPLSFVLGRTLVPRLTALPDPVRGLVISIVMIVLMTWVLMPRATRLFKRFLYPQLARSTRSRTTI